VTWGTRTTEPTRSAADVASRARCRWSERQSSAQHLDHFLEPAVRRLEGVATGTRCGNKLELANSSRKAAVISPNSRPLLSVCSSTSLIALVILGAKVQFGREYLLLNIRHRGPDQRLHADGQGRFEAAPAQTLDLGSRHKIRVTGTTVGWVTQPD
jgi:hypothetical protein